MWSKVKPNDPSYQIHPVLPVFCTATATLLLQIVQTRVYAVVFWNHLVYFIISIALLGYGISGTWLAFGRTTPLARLLTLRNAAIGFVLSALCSSLFVPQFGVSIASAILNKYHALQLVATYSTAVFPYFFAGWILGSLYRDHAARIHSLYFADLIGAGLGCIMFLILIRPLGAVPLVLIACALVSLPIFVGEYRATKKTAVLCLAVLNLVLLISLAAVRDKIDKGIQPDAMKGFNGVYKNLAPGDERVIEFSEWNSIARTDVTGTKRTPAKSIFTDGAAFSGIELHVEAIPPPFDRETECLVPHATAYVLHRRFNRALVIGSGGGLDVWNALRAGAHSVDAVEINPTTAHVVVDEYRAVSHGLFLRPEVHLWNEEGRSFVRRADARYDVVMINAIDTFAALDAGAYMLAENYLYTVDGIRDYLTHLTPTGVLCITRWVYAGESIRLFSVMLEAICELGYSEPLRHIVAQTNRNWTAILVSPTPFTQDEMGALRTTTERLGGQFLFPLPGEAWTHPLQRELNTYAKARVEGRQEQFYSACDYNIRPVWDDSPFFFHYEKGKSLWRIFSENSFQDFVRGHWPTFTLSALMIMVSVGLFLFVFLPLRRRGRGDLPHFRAWLLYFCCIGVAFIFVEISLMQRFALLLGHPSRSLALVLASLLVFAGIGSQLKQQWNIPLGGALAALMAAILLAAFAYPWCIRAMLGWPLWLRGSLSVAMVAPVALFMGMPFPFGTRAVSEKSQDAVPWMWGVNGGATVLGSIAAIAVAIQFSFTTVLVLAAAGYAMALAAHLFILHTQDGKEGVTSSPVEPSGAEK